MSRDPSGIYSYPDGTRGSPGTTIFSARYNTFLDDLAVTLNTKLPINMGGTNANNADAALKNLSAEKATQLVTDYNTHVWFPGSFRSAAAAPGAPNATSSFAGIAYINEPLENPPTNENVVVEARDMDSPVKPGLLYTRQKTDGVWSAWNYAGTGDDQTAARSAIYAAPFDAMAYNGMQINGSFDVSQELGSNFRSTSGYVCDGWILSSSIAGFNYVAVRTPAAFGSISGVSYHLHLEALNIGVVGAGDIVAFNQLIEGTRTARLAWGTSAAQPITIAFWTAHKRTGTYTVTVRNSPTTRSYCATYTQNVSGVAEYKTITIPGCTSGTWKIDNTVSFIIDLTLFAGATYTAPSANTWNNGTYVAAPGQIGSPITSGDLFYFSNFILLPGTQAPTAAQSSLIMRPYDQELAMCQRYYAKEYASSRFTAVGAGNLMETLIYFKTTMRSAPTAVLGTAIGGYGNVAATYPQVPNTYPEMARWLLVAAAAGDCYALIVPVMFDARL